LTPQRAASLKARNVLSTFCCWRKVSVLGQNSVPDCVVSARGNSGSKDQDFWLLAHITSERNREAKAAF